MKSGSRRREGSKLLAAAFCAVVVVGSSAVVSASGMKVVCNPVSGEVTVVSDAEVGLRVPMSEFLPGTRTAEIWIEENCPSRQCGRDGRCVAAAPSVDPNGWYVLCRTGSGDVGVVRGVVPSGFTVIAGPFAEQDGAESWIESDNPGRSCGPSGACAASADAAPAAIAVESTAGPAQRRVDLGATVGTVAEGSSAQAAGFRAGDVVRKLDGVEIGSADELKHRLEAIPPGTWMIFDLNRDRQHLSFGMSRPAGSIGLGMEDEIVASPSPPAVATSSAWTVGAVNTGERSSSNGVGGGWTVGEVLTGNGAVGTARSGAVVGPQSVGPDLTPLVDAARVSVAACAYSTALANADQLARFDPASPWLDANHERLRRLAQRQRTTEQAIWRAGNLLNAGKLKDARKAVYDAAGTAVACQDEAVSVLLRRIDEVIAHNRARKQARNARLAGELLAGLFVVNQGVIAHQNGTLGNPGAATAPVIAVIDGATGGSGDPCQFNYSYPAGAMSVEPICGCGGYHYDAIKLRCVK